MKKKIIIAMLIAIVLTGGGIYGYKAYKKNKEEKNNQLEKEHYKTLYSEMYAYYKVMFKFLNVPEDKKDEKFVLSLGDLERAGFPMDKFINFKDNSKCDTALSYATREVKDNKYVITVYYKCGNVANYDYVTKLQNKEKIDNIYKKDTNE